MLNNSNSILKLYFNPVSYFEENSNGPNRFILYFFNFMNCFAILYYNRMLDFKTLEIPFAFNKESFFYTYYHNPSWTDLFTYTLLFSFISYFLLWYPVTWWFKKNLHWSGVKEARSDKIRYILILFSTYFTIPIIITIPFYVFIYSEPKSALESLNLLFWLFIVFGIIETYFFYKTIKRLFVNINNWGLLWFVIIPIISVVSEFFSIYEMNI